MFESITAEDRQKMAQKIYGLLLNNTIESLIVSNNLISGIPEHDERGDLWETYESIGCSIYIKIKKKKSYNQKGDL